MQRNGNRREEAKGHHKIILKMIKIELLVRIVEEMIQLR